MTPTGIHVVQLIGTLALIAAPLDNYLKSVLLLSFWAATFRPVARAELAVFASMCVLFTAMNAAALARGTFLFARPDVLRMPAWELFMWGFYVLHLLRVVQGPAPRGSPVTVLALAGAFAVPFATVADPDLLLVSTGAVLALAFTLFRERHDWLYAGYMLVVGTLVEYTGVWSGQWSYPAVATPGGVPPWFVTMWAGVGLFVRRLIVPSLRCASLPNEGVAPDGK